MGKLVVLNLGEGDFNRGFGGVTLRIGEDGASPSTEINGKLPSVPELPDSYSNWQKNGMIPRLGNKHKPSSEQLKIRLNSWLNSEPFRPIREKLLEQLTPDDEVRVIIQVQDIQLRRLPWHLWDFFERYPKAEIALSAPKYDRVTLPKTSRTKVNILAILGDSTGINVEEDKKILQQLPNAKIQFLVKPERRELTDQLWEQPCDILFFAGHSCTEGETGRLYINDTESLTIADLKYGLKKASAQGLQLAIFNSCDGLGLAQELGDLQIPQIIVMREPVPDKVAQEFLKYFLVAFAGGKSFYLAVREARERLQGLETQFPCASWLPVICQNPAVTPPSWVNLIKNQPTVTNLSKLVEEIIADGAKNEILSFNTPNSCPLPVVMFVGTSAVGKSSLTNAIFGGRQIARVSAVAQDDEQTVAEDWAGVLKIMDSVSYDQNCEETKLNLQVADVLVHVCDIGAIRRDDINLFHLIQKSGKPCITVLNKCDVYDDNRRDLILNRYRTSLTKSVHFLSATTGENIKSLTSKIIHLIPDTFQKATLEKLVHLEKVKKCRNACEKIIFESQIEVEALLSSFKNEKNVLSDTLKKLYELMVEHIKHQYLGSNFMNNNLNSISTSEIITITRIILCALEESNSTNTLKSQEEIAIQWTKAIGKVTMDFYEARIHINQISEHTKTVLALLPR